MLKSNLHRLLRRQISNAGFLPEDLEKFKDFFGVVDEAYKNFDDDVKHIEVILEESSNELYKLNQALKSKVHNVENELNTMVNTIEGVIFKTDVHGNFKYLNKAWEELIGVPVDRALGKNYTDFLFGINQNQKEKIERFLKKEQSDYQTFFKYYKPTGEKLWIQLRLNLTYDSDNKLTGTIGTLIDITQLKETEIELNRANKIKDDFVSTMSHEIRTPLNAVIGMSEILLMDNFLPEQLENLQVLKYSSEHLLTLINDLLDLNKFKSKEIKLTVDDFNLLELVQNIKLQFKQPAINKKLHFKVVTDKSIPVVVKGDSLKLAQVLKNLLSNAFKFTEEGSVTLKAEVVNYCDCSTIVRFTVTDTGIGVSYNKQKDIFKSFVQASDTTSKLYGGSGLGLYISKELLKIQNSKLQLKSAKGKGSSFWFDIEFPHSKKNIISTQFVIPETQSIDLKVLVAEDNKMNALLLKKLFEKWNLEYKIAGNGAELLELYDEEDFDLILMDLQMPVLDGYETTRAIRKMDNQSKAIIPIIALTAFTKSEVNEKIRRYKMNGYLSKPFNVNELHGILKFHSKKEQLL